MIEQAQGSQDGQRELPHAISEDRSQERWPSHLTLGKANAYRSLSVPSLSP